MSEVVRSGYPGGGGFQGRSSGVCPTPKSATPEVTRAHSVGSPVGGISPPTPGSTSREPDPRLTSLSQSPDLDPRSSIHPTFLVTATRRDSFDSLPLQLFFSKSLSFNQRFICMTNNHQTPEQPIRVNLRFGPLTDSALRAALQTTPRCSRAWFIRMLIMKGWDQECMRFRPLTPPHPR